MIYFTGKYYIKNKIKVNNNKFYNIPSLKYIFYLIKKYIYIKIFLNFIFISLLDIYLLNKYYKLKNNPTDILIFKNIFFSKKYYDLYICNIIVELKSMFFFKNLNFTYTSIFIHGFLHCQNFLHKKYFFEKNIFNYLELKFLKKIGN